MIKILLLFCAFYDLGPTSQQSKSTATLSNVTIYQSGAQLEHVATEQLKSGNQELVIDGISSHLDINSIRVNCASAVTILGIEFNNNFLGEENLSPFAVEIKDSIDRLQSKIQQLNIQINTNTELLDVLRSNRDLRGSQSGMSVAELSKLMEYYKTKSLDVQTELMNLNNKKKDLQNQVSKLNNQLTEEQKKNTKSSGRLTLQLNVATAGKFDFNITYFSSQAYWTPYYDIKCNSIKDPLDITYKAKIFQSTGIDWKKVKLSLSTASPQTHGAAPLLRTWFLGYINPIVRMDKKLSETNTYGALQGRAPGLEINKESNITGSTVIIRGSSSITGSNDMLYVVNGLPMEANEFQKIDPESIKDITVLKDANATAIYGARGSNGVVVATLKSGLEDYISVSESTLEVVYDIDIPYDVPTNGKAQIATLKNEKLQATYKHYAVPKLSKDVYLLAEVANWETMNFLPGEANIIFEGTFIGKSFLDPATEKDTLNLTLGVDKRVVVKKELMKDFSSVKFVGSNKTQNITYDISVRNNKNEPIQLTLKEPFPISTTKEIVVSLEEHSNGNVNDEIGVVTWQLNIPAGNTDKKRIGYSVKYPKNKKVNL